MYSEPIPSFIFPAPDYDSGWFTISQNQTLTKTHNLGGNVDTYIVKLDGKDTTWGLNGNFFYRDGYDYYGLHWRNLTTSTIQIYRGDNDSRCPQARIRIWLHA